MRTLLFIVSILFGGHATQAIEPTSIEPRSLAPNSMPVTHSATFKSFSSSPGNSQLAPPASTNVTTNDKGGPQMGATLPVQKPNPVETTPPSLLNKNPEEDDKKDSNDEDKITFTDKIKTIRVQGGDYDVFFMEHPGAYYVPYSLPDSKISPEQILSEASKKILPVTVTVDPDTDTLLAIEPLAGREPTSTKESPLDPELKDYREILERAVAPK